MPTARTATALVLVALLVVTSACTSSSDRDASDRPADRVAEPLDADLTVTADGPGRRVPDAFFGFNAASIVQTVNVDLLLGADLQAELATFPVRLLRIPTGTAAQWIDWRTGAFIENPTSPFASIPADRRPVTMDDWATMIERTGATPVWDLNVLNATLDDQLAMLDEADRLGLPVEFIELGNELWDTRSIYPEKFPTGADYAHAMNEWIPAIRERFPSAHIAVCGADPSDEFFSVVFGERFDDWNTQVLATIRDADALTIHPYWTLPDRADPGSDVDATLAAGPDAWGATLDGALVDVPDDMAVWVTEWNQAAWGSKAGTQIWAQALSVVSVALAQLVDPRIEMSLVHDIVDGTENPHDVGISTTFPAFTNGAGESKPLERTALGHALPLLFGAVGPGSTATRMDFAAADPGGETAGLSGVRIDGEDPGAVIVNRSANDTAIDLGSTMPGDWSAKTLTAPADAEPGWDPDDTVTVTDSSTTGILRIPPYSILRLSRR